MIRRLAHGSGRICATPPVRGSAVSGNSTERSRSFPSGACAKCDHLGEGSHIGSGVPNDRPPAPALAQPATDIDARRHVRSHTSRHPRRGGKRPIDQQSTPPPARHQSWGLPHTWSRVASIVLVKSWSWVRSTRAWATLVYESTWIRMANIRTTKRQSAYSGEPYPPGSVAFTQQPCIR